MNARDVKIEAIRSIHALIAGGGVRLPIARIARAPWRARARAWFRYSFVFGVRCRTCGVCCNAFDVPFEQCLECWFWYERSDAPWVIANRRPG